MNVTRLGMMLAVSVCAIPIWAMSSTDDVKTDDVKTDDVKTDDVKTDEAAWKAAWLRGIQHLPPAATPFPAAEALLQSAILKRPTEGEVAVDDSLREPLYAETPFLSLGEPLAQGLLTER